MADRMNLITPDTKIKVSSDKSASKKHLIDGSPETCWTSQQDLPQSIQLMFPQPVAPKLLTFTFQGGFVGTHCVIQTTAPSEDSTAKPIWENLTIVYPEDVNRKQVFDLPPMPSPKGISGIKFVFEKSSDFFGRITIYDLSLEGSSLASD